MRGNEENEFECKIELKKKLTHSLNNNIKRKTKTINDDNNNKNMVK